MSSKRGYLTYYWALTAVFAAFQFIMTYFPYSIALGGTGGALTIGLISAPLIGMILGPVYGTLAVLIGSILGMLANPAAQVMGLLTAFAPTTSALIAGSIITKKWEIVPIVYIGAFAIFLLSPIGILALSFLWLHIGALLLSFLFIIPVTSRLLNDALQSPPKSGVYRLTFAVWLVVLVSVLADHIVGSAIAGFYFYHIFGLEPGVLAGFFTGVIFIYPLERILASIIGALLTYFVIVALSTMNIPMPTRSDEDSTWKEFPEEETEV